MNCHIELSKKAKYSTARKALQSELTPFVSTHRGQFRGGNYLDLQWDLLKEASLSEVNALAQAALASGKHVIVRDR